MSRKDAEEELARLRAEQAVVREASDAERLLTEETRMRLEDLRQRRYDPTPTDVRLLSHIFSSMCFRVLAEARLRVVEEEKKERARREKQ
jgi:hypothetical protein